MVFQDFCAMMMKDSNRTEQSRIYTYLQLKFTTVLLCNYWQHWYHSTFSYKVVSILIAEAEAQKHHLPRQCLDNLFAKVI